MIYHFSIGVDGYINNYIQSTCANIDSVSSIIKDAFTPQYIEAVYPNGKRIRIKDARFRIILIEDENNYDYYPDCEWFEEE